jgi:hypothetical protein
MRQGQQGVDGGSEKPQAPLTPCSFLPPPPPCGGHHPLKWPSRELKNKSSFVLGTWDWVRRARVPPHGTARRWVAVAVCCAAGLAGCAWMGGWRALGGHPWMEEGDPRPRTAAARRLCHPARAKKNEARDQQQHALSASGLPPAG